ncbi:XXYLT1 [Acanthosepion pharaonis]|uniref:XXYLT1 n=1 Tax=Acanthosepion pharaonis TaxID=158019 RepID=A0A812CIM4_ACAPH|nr:XXYLT1 [Sepia pharaonis]
MDERRPPSVSSELLENLGQATHGSSSSTPDSPTRVRGPSQNRFKFILIAIATVGIVLLLVSFSLINIDHPTKKQHGNPRGDDINKPQAVNYRTGPSETLRADAKEQDTELPVLLTFTNFVTLDIDNLTGLLLNIIHGLQQFFSSKQDTYYSQSLFFLSLAIHRIMPSTLKKLIMLDVDLKFEADIAQLFGHFDRFADTNIIGIAREMQPVYRHIFHAYRDENPGTRVGGPPPDGLTGFNSGVLLLNMERMRKSELYNAFLEHDVIHNLTIKYKFQGHLGDQDFFTLLSMEHEELFYILPCTWNRQLCQWWRDKGYEDVFDDYYSCTGKVNIFHGNCHTLIPS